MRRLALELELEAMDKLFFLEASTAYALTNP
jgi:hypothetical protein